MTRFGIFLITIAGIALAGGATLLAETNLATATMLDYYPDYYPYIMNAGKVANNVPSDAVSVLAELRTCKVAKPEEARNLIWQSLTKEERKSMASAMSRLPRVAHLRRIADKVNDDIVAGDLVWVVNMSLPAGPIVSTQNVRCFFIPARTGKIISYNQVPEDTARRLADLSLVLLIGSRASTPEAVRPDMEQDNVTMVTRSGYLPSEEDQHPLIVGSVIPQGVQGYLDLFEDGKRRGQIIVVYPTNMKRPEETKRLIEIKGKLHSFTLGKPSQGLHKRTYENEAIEVSEWKYKE